MQVSVEVKEGLKRALKVSIPAADVDRAIDNRLKEMLPKVKIKGFRAGKVPLTEVKRRYSGSVREEVVGQLLQKSFYDAIEQENLHVTGSPTITPANMAEGQPLEYTAEVEILPEFEPVELAGVDIIKSVATLTEADINDGIENLRKQHVTWADVDRPSKTEDQVIIDYKGMMNGVVFEGGSANDVPIVIGSNTMIPGFEAGLVNLKSGDSTTLNISFPEKYDEKFAGKPVTFEVSIKKVQEAKLPAIDDKLAEKFNIKKGGLAALREEVRKNLQRSLEQMIKGQVRRQLIENLLRLNEIDTPDSLVDNEIKRMQHEVAHKYSRGSKEQAEKILSNMPKENFKEQALLNVKTGLIFGELINRKNLSVDNDRVKEYVKTMAVSYQNPDQVIKWYYDNKKELAEVKRIVLEEQIIDEVLKSANVIEKPQTYQELLESVK